MNKVKITYLMIRVLSQWPARLIVHELSVVFSFHNAYLTGLRDTLKSQPDLESSRPSPVPTVQKHARQEKTATTWQVGNVAPFSK